MTAITVSGALLDYLESMESVIERSCLECVRRPDRLFCGLTQDALRDFDLLKSLAIYPRGTILLRQGQPARSVFVLCQGRAKLSVCSESGTQLTLRIANPGEVLGLSAALVGGFHEISAELLENAQVAVVKRKDLLEFLHQHRDACLQVVSRLSQDLHFAYDRVRSVGLGQTRRPRAAHVH
ncbi:MAG TPA: cyclic nucleotide-binding domain-containing protein [Terriglobales bacterium]|nr:cyclic nucleotide-binding domain-containing protein [Terriglobales bacterium]